MTTAPVVTVTDDLIAELEAEYNFQRRAMVSLRYEHLGALLAERAELKRDAERYRWLRDQESERGVSVVNINQWISAAQCVAVTFVDGSFVDHAIDAAMQEQGK